jgi:hypothetical protein
MIYQEPTGPMRRNPATISLRACQMIEMGEDLKAELHLRASAQLVRTSLRGTTATTTWMRQTHGFIIGKAFGWGQFRQLRPRLRAAIDAPLQSGIDRGRTPWAIEQSCHHL